MDAASVKLAGNSTLHFTREMVIFRSSRDCRNTSSTFRLNSGSSSRNKTPVMRQADLSRLRETSAACHGYCGDGMVRITKRTFGNKCPPSCPSFPATECILVVSRLSPNDNGGSIEGRRLASMDFPLPGAPTRRILCPPAAATSNARFAFSCPFTSEKSRSKLFCRV